MNKLFIALLSASITSAILCNGTATVETDKDKAVVTEAVVEAVAAKKSKCANCPCTAENKAAEVTAETEKAATVDCPCEEAGKACPCPSMQAEQQ